MPADTDLLVNPNTISGRDFAAAIYGMRLLFDDEPKTVAERIKIAAMLRPVANSIKPNGLDKPILSMDPECLQEVTTRMSEVLNLESIDYAPYLTNEAIKAIGEVFGKLHSYGFGYNSEINNKYKGLKELVSDFNMSRINKYSLGEGIIHYLTKDICESFEQFNEFFTVDNIKIMQKMGMRSFDPRSGDFSMEMHRFIATTYAGAVYDLEVFFKSASYTLEALEQIKQEELEKDDEA